MVSTASTVRLTLNVYFVLVALRPVYLSPICSYMYTKFTAPRPDAGQNMSAQDRCEPPCRFWGHTLGLREASFQCNVRESRALPIGPSTQGMVWVHVPRLRAPPGSYDVSGAFSAVRTAVRY